MVLQYDRDEVLCRMAEGIGGILMKKIWRITLACLLFLTACRAPGGHTTPVTGSQNKVVLYFANSQGTDLISVNLDVYEQETEELPGIVEEPGTKPCDSHGNEVVIRCKGTNPGNGGPV